MRRILITVQYLGANFNGVQAQKDESKITVQGVLEDAIQKVLQTKPTIYFSGRLDGGVSALALPAHFDINSEIELDKLQFATNNYLPDYIQVTSIKEVPLTFHARYDAKEKTYRYTMYVSRWVEPFLHRDAMQLYKEPSVELMKEGAKFLVGKHDFSAFMSKNSSIKGTVRTIKFLNIEQKGNVITVEVCGDGFLYNMVRIIVGTLLNVGYSKYEPQMVKSILEGKVRKNAGKMVEAKGLCLIDVKY
ncbi:MAG: tRNA pseudouridine(38-40) synthase TruA [Spirochaetales bacterium]